MKMKVLTLALLGGFIGLMFLSLFSVGHSVDTKHGSVDCIFATQSETICSTGVLDHIGAWKSVFVNMLPTVSVVLLVGVIAIFNTVPPHLCRRRQLHTIPITQLFRQFQLRLYTFVYRTHQELFARGILHPKLF